MGVYWLNLATVRHRTGNPLKSIGKIIMDDAIQQALNGSHTGIARAIPVWNPAVRRARIPPK
jgi:hypothetical protein